MLRERLRRYRASHMIRRAIDTYPDGICFARESGRVVLSNKTLNDVCARLTGHTVTNAAAMWRELAALAKAQAIGDGSPHEEEKPAHEELLLRVGEQAIWRFRTSRLTVREAPVIQYEASDVTALFDAQQRLRESNKREAALHARQRELLKNIVQNNLSQELLAAKLRIHDDFGRLILMTGQALSEGEGADIETLQGAWIGAVRDMENAAAPEMRHSPREELVRVAKLIGCQVVFEGPEPQERKAVLLLYAAIREALTNAIRHAGADRLTVCITEDGYKYHVRISDNGKKAVSAIREGSGLSALRQRLEQEMATLNYDFSDGLTLILTIPKEDKHDQRADRGGFPGIPGGV